MERQCNYCNKVKNIKSFVKCKDCKHGRAWKCYSCKNNGLDSSHRAKKSQQKLKDKYNTLKKKCSICDETAPECLEFHHIDKKDRDIGGGLVAVINELKKCCVVCSNCHKKIHAGTIKAPPKITIKQIEEALDVYIHDEASVSAELDYVASGKD